MRCTSKGATRSQIFTTIVNYLLSTTKNALNNNIQQNTKTQLGWILITTKSVSLKLYDKYPRKEVKHEVP